MDQDHHGRKHKLGVVSGVYTPVCLNILSILMFLRFGLILGQIGLLGILGQSVFACPIFFFPWGFPENPRKQNWRLFIETRPIERDLGSGGAPRQDRGIRGRSLLTPYTSGLVFVSYLIDLVTALSLSAVASTGEVKGGGAYYLISRSLGPEFGGSIGLLFYLSPVLNMAKHVAGLVDCLRLNLGDTLPEGYWWGYFVETAALVLCTALCLAGSDMFA